jgi:putative DNA primase/helicase
MALERLGENRPLYGLYELLSRPGAPIIVVEGERKVDAARRLLPGYIAISPMNGAKSPHKSDWTPIAGRNVTIWPDHDEPGRGFAEAVAELARAVGAASIAVVKIPEQWPEHWDIADPLADGVSPKH